jgi:hypothetical protein
MIPVFCPFYGRIVERRQDFARHSQQYQFIVPRFKYYSGTSLTLLVEFNAEITAACNHAIPESETTLNKWISNDGTKSTKMHGCYQIAVSTQKHSSIIVSTGAEECSNENWLAGEGEYTDDFFCMAQSDFQTPKYGFRICMLDRAANPDVGKGTRTIRRFLKWSF